MMLVTTNHPYLKMIRHTYDTRAVVGEAGSGGEVRGRPQKAHVSRAPGRTHARSMRWGEADARGLIGCDVERESGAGSRWQVS
jgi:hypothetical protein